MGLLNKLRQRSGRWTSLVTCGSGLMTNHSPNVTVEPGDHRREVTALVEVGIPVPTIGGALSPEWTKFEDHDGAGSGQTPRR
jgi:hypothetical protein